MGFMWLEVMLQYEWYMQVEKCKRSNEVSSSCLLRGILKLYQQQPSTQSEKDTTSLARRPHFLEYY